jgi:hypothetical protein
VNGCGPGAFRSSPGNRSTQSVINLESGSAITKTLQPPAISPGKLRARDTKKLPGCDIGKKEVSVRKPLYLLIDLNTAAKMFKVASENIRKSFGAAAQNRPAASMACGNESQTDRSRSWCL